MVKRKSKAKIAVADGTGGMVTAEDHRFEDDWPIKFEVPRGNQADTWLRYLQDECRRRSWASSRLGQIEARENSGSININTGATPLLAIVWERKQAHAIKVRARFFETPEFGAADARSFLEHVNDRCRSGVKDRFYSRGHLHYNGLPWRGELWLDDTLRLGAPSRQDETALIGPRIILVDSLLECVGLSDVPWALDHSLRELAAFLSVVMGKSIQLPQNGRAWTWEPSASTNCAVRQLGYLELDNPPAMPVRKNASRLLPLRAVSRPDFSLRGIRVTDSEQSLPADVIDLWTSYRSLPADLGRQFLQAAAKWQEALMIGRERSTLSFALMVVACEALKPSGREFWDHNIYHVVEALLGTQHVAPLRQHPFPPKAVRGRHLHRGEFHGSEFVQAAITSTYEDPSFDQAHRAVAWITQAAIIEWLRCRGEFTMPVHAGRRRR